MVKWYLILSLIIAGSSLLEIQGQSNAPNILVVVADDLGVDALNGFKSSPTLSHTPHLDSLRSVGLTFANAWSMSQCTPSRAAMISGQYGIKTGVTQAPGTLDPIFGSIFLKIKEVPNTSYTTSTIGKWHISSANNLTHPQSLGVDHFEGFMGPEVPDYYDWEKVTNGTKVQVNEYATAHLTQVASDWIAK